MAAGGDPGNEIQLRVKAQREAALARNDLRMREAEQLKDWGARNTALTQARSERAEIGHPELKLKRNIREIQFEMNRLDGGRPDAVQMERLINQKLEKEFELQKVVDVRIVSVKESPTQ